MKREDFRQFAVANDFVIANLIFNLEIKLTKSETEPELQNDRIIKNQMTRSEFIEKNKHLFWYIKKDKIQDIDNEILVEFIFNYGTWDDVKDLIKIIGYQELKNVYDGITDRKIGNYIPEMFDLLKRITFKNAS